MEILTNLSALGLSETDFETAKTEPEIIKKVHDTLDAYFKKDPHHWPCGRIPEFTVKDYIAGKPWVNAILLTVRDWNFELTTKWSPSKEPDQRLYHMVIADTTSEPISWLHGEHTYAFGVEGTFDGLPDPENDSEDPNEALDRFIEELQAVIRPDDACIITNAGWEKLRYVGGNALIITRDKAFNLNLAECAARKTRELLDDPAWEPQT